MSYPGRQHRLLPIFTLPYPSAELDQLLRLATTTMDAEGAVQYLKGLLGRQLRVHTTDSRMFIGIFKCTDAVSEFPRKEG